MINILVVVFGLLVGSFLNVIICRFGKKDSILYDRSKCPSCEKALTWYDLVPVFSFLLLKGRCRYCNEKINWQYPIVEISTGLLFLLAFNQFIAFGLLTASLLLHHISSGYRHRSGHRW